MPGGYISESRELVLQTSVEREPEITVATLIHLTVCDFLHQKQFKFAAHPEFVDMAVIMTGLGILRSNISLVETSSPFWDLSKWEMIQRAFLDSRSAAYVFAISAWIRDQAKPGWLREVHPDLRGNVSKSLKFLNKTNDSFLQATSADSKLLGQPQAEWIKLAKSKPASQQIIAITQLSRFVEPSPQAVELLHEKLNSANESVVMHSIETLQRLGLVNDSIVESMVALVDHRNDDVSAKALIWLAEFEKVDEETMHRASKMLSSRVQHVEFAAIYAISTLSSIPDDVMEAANRGLVRSLQLCEYEMFNYYAAGFNHWLIEPETHFENLLSDESPEYLRIAIESLDNIQSQLPVVPQA